ncbi:MAG: hypothetical protein H7039_13465 [Bryobacteraceae bacterium]|nr:hypothetical protein [Bryobacteraceae bacterium]
MPAALLVRFRPAGPWRLGPDDGARHRTASVLHSDALYSAITIAMRDLGWIEEWLGVTAESSDVGVRLTSCYPYTGRLLMIEPPRSLWPLAQSGKLRWKAARLVPVSVIPSLIANEVLQEGSWAVDPVSECLLPVTKNGPMHPPFRVVRRRLAPVDRMSGASESTTDAACLQFAPASGMWFAATFATEEIKTVWLDRMRAACRLLADSGIGGGRSRGWGRSEEPRFETPQDLTRMLTGTAASNGGESAWWLLSLFSPGAADDVDWKRGNYRITIRSGRTETATSWGELKARVNMISEGSVVLSGTQPLGASRNIAADGAAHPVYRSGIAVAIAIPWRDSRRLPWMGAEEPATVTAAPDLAVGDVAVGEVAVGEVAEVKPVESGWDEPAVVDELGAAEEVLVEQDEPTVLDEPAAGEANLIEEDSEALEETVVGEESALEEPPVEEPPVEEPPAIEPPVQEPPAEAPPVNEPEALEEELHERKEEPLV